jgi:hypothetical protein
MSNLTLTLGIIGNLVLVAALFALAGAAGHLVITALKDALLYGMTRVGIIRPAVLVELDPRR